MSPRKTKSQSKNAAQPVWARSGTANRLIANSVDIGACETSSHITGTLPRETRRSARPLPIIIGRPGGITRRARFITPAFSRDERTTGVIRTGTDE